MIEGAKEKLNNYIEEGKRNVSLVLAEVQDEFKNREDIIAKPAVIDFTVGNETRGIGVTVDNKVLQLTKHSESQLYARTGVPAQYAGKLYELGEFGLLRDNLKTMVNKQCSDGLLFRHVGATTKGILSPSYRRMDAAPVFEAYVQSALDSKFVPYKAHNTEYRYQIQFLYPEIFQPAPNEYLVYGVSLTTGDYGSQALEIELLALRIMCRNLAVGYDLLRKVHLGKRFQFNENEEAVQLSDKTHLLDSQAIASAVSDVTKSSITQIEHVHKVVQDSVSKEVDIKSAIMSLRKKGMSKEIAEKIKTTYEMEAPIEVLPQQKGLWRLSNAISLVAQGIPEPDKRIDTQKIAMGVLLEA